MVGVRVVEAGGHVLPQVARARRQLLLGGHGHQRAVGHELEQLAEAVDGQDVRHVGTFSLRARGGHLRQLSVLGAELGGGRDLHPLGLLQRALGERREPGEPLHLDVEQLAAHRALLGGRVDVEDVAANGELAALLHLIDALVATGHQLSGHLVEVEQLALLDLEAVRTQVGVGQLLGQRRGARHHHGGLFGEKRVERRDAQADQVRRRGQVRLVAHAARRIEAHLPGGEKCPQVGGQVAGRSIVAGHHQRRTLGLGVEQAGQQVGPQAGRDESALRLGAGGVGERVDRLVLAGVFEKCSEHAQRPPGAAARLEQLSLVAQICVHPLALFGFLGYEHVSRPPFQPWMANGLTPKRTLPLLALTGALIALVAPASAQAAECADGVRKRDVRIQLWKEARCKGAWIEVSLQPGRRPARLQAFSPLATAIATTSTTTARRPWSPSTTAFASSPTPNYGGRATRLRCGRRADRSMSLPEGISSMRACPRVALTLCRRRAVAGSGETPSSSSIEDFALRPSRQLSGLLHRRRTTRDVPARRRDFVALAERIGSPRLQLRAELARRGRRARRGPGARLGASTAARRTTWPSATPSWPGSSPITRTAPATTAPAAWAFRKWPGTVAYGPRRAGGRAFGPSRQGDRRTGWIHIALTRAGARLQTSYWD